MTLAYDGSNSYSGATTINGTLPLGGSGSSNYGYLQFSGAETLGGTGTVVGPSSGTSPPGPRRA